MIYEKNKKIVKLGEKFKFENRTVVINRVGNRKESVNNATDDCNNYSGGYKKLTETTIKKSESIKKRITVLFFVSTLFLTVIGLSKCNKKSNYRNDSVTNGISQNIDNNNDESNVDSNTNTDTVTDNNKKGTDSVESSFDHIVTISDNLFIYTNCYDDTYITNSYNPYYKGYHERDIQGIVYEFNGNIYVIYENDVNVSSIKKELEDKGAIITDVLVTRNDLIHTGEYEGYYNVNSVKVKSRK